MYRAVLVEVCMILFRARDIRGVVDEIMKRSRSEKLETTDLESRDLHEAPDVISLNKIIAGTPKAPEVRQNIRT